MRKLIIGLFIIMTIVANSLTALAAAAPEFSTSAVERGVVSVKYDSEDNTKIKVLVEKGGKRYAYNLKANGKYEQFPLQMGNGEYKVSVLENTGGTKYRYLSTTFVSVDLKDDTSVFLNSIQLVRWNDSMETVKKARELTAKMKTDEEKIKAVYNYVVRNFKYDYDKISKLTYDYLPDVDLTLKSKKGICYDYSSVFAAMLRSVGVPTKLVTGYTENAKGFHAWNEVYIAKTGTWMVVDTTYDSQVKTSKVKYSMEKDSRLYQKTYEY